MERDPILEGGGVGDDRTLLVVDDERCIRSVMALLLEELGYDVVQAKDGEAALEAVEKRPVDGVFLDLSMPDLSGAEVFRRLRSVAPDVPVVVMSGHSEAEAIYRLNGQKPTGYLSKPFTPDSLEAMIRTAFGTPATR